MALDFDRHRKHGWQPGRRLPAASLPRSLPWRLFVLAGLLVAVMFTMRAARDPGNWRWMWQLGPPRDGDERSAPREIDTRLPPTTAPRAGQDAPDSLLIPRAPAPWERTGRAEDALDGSAEGRAEADRAAQELRHGAWARVVEQLTVAEKTCLLKGLKSARGLQPLPADQHAAWIAVVQRLEQSWVAYLDQASAAVTVGESRLDADAQQRWKAAIGGVRTDWQERFAPGLRALVSEYAGGDSELPVLNEVQDALDQIFLRAVVDNTVWRPAETEAWFRLLDKASQPPAAKSLAVAERVTFLQLYKQPDVYRGKPVTVRGAVRMVEHYQAPENLYGIGSYYALWLKPISSHSPIVVYCRQLPAGFPRPAGGQARRQSLNEEVEVAGYFFKRWAYRAGDGMRLAPLVLAQTPRWESAAASAGAKRPPAIGWGLTILVLGGTWAAAFGLVLLVHFQSKRSARRHERLRITDRPFFVLCFAAAVALGTPAHGAATATVKDGPGDPSSVSDGLGDPTSMSDQPVCCLSALLSARCGSTALVAAQPPYGSGAVPRGLGSAREFLELYRLGTSQLAEFVDGQDREPREDELLWRLLHRLPQITPDMLDAWQRRDADWADVAARPASHRADVFRLTGPIRQLARVALAPEVADRVGYTHYYRVRLSLGESLPTAVIYARRVPEAWEHTPPQDEPAGCLALLLKAGAANAGGPELIFAADRVAWYPDRVAEELRITASHVLLGSHGMDVGLFDDVRRTNGRPLEAEDRECFYQLLAAMGRMAPGELFQRTEGGFALAPMLTQPETQHGRLIGLRGTALRVQKVVIESEETRHRLGFDHYFQIDVMVPLGNQEVRLRAAGGAPAGGAEDVNEARDEQRPAGKEKPSPGPLFEHNFPITCCALQLPPGFPQEENPRQPVHLAGFYFKLWAYRSEYVSGFDARKRQPAPLFIVTTPRLVRPPATSAAWRWVGGSLMVLLLVGVSVALWRMHRADRRHQELARRQREQLTPLPSRGAGGQ